MARRLLGSVESYRRILGGRRRRLLASLLGLGSVAAIFFYILPRFASYGDAWIVLNGLSWRQVALVVGVTLFNLATYAPPLMTVLRLSFTQATGVAHITTAVGTMLPGGHLPAAAVEYRILRRLGQQPPQIVSAIVVLALSNQLITVALPTAGLALLAASGVSAPFLVEATVAGSVLLSAVVAGSALLLGRNRLTGRLKRRFERAIAVSLARIGDRPTETLTGQLIRCRQITVRLIRRRWMAVTSTEILGQLTVFLVLLTCLRACGTAGSDVSVTEAFAAWSVVRLLTVVPIVPGGVGLVELGLSTALIQFGGVSSQVLAGVLLYRAATVLPPILLGAGFAFAWRHSWRAAVT